MPSCPQIFLPVWCYLSGGTYLPGSKGLIRGPGRVTAVTLVYSILSCLEEKLHYTKAAEQGLGKSTIPELPFPWLQGGISEPSSPPPPPMVLPGATPRILFTELFTNKAHVFAARGQLRGWPV